METGRIPPETNLKLTELETPFIIGKDTEPSIKHPGRNGTSFFTDEKLGIVGLFDDIGRLDADVPSSQLSALEVESLLQQPGPGYWIEGEIKEALAAADKKIKTTTPQTEVAASVVQIGILSTGERHQVLAVGAGDVRVWVYRKNGNLLQLTEDDTTLRNDFLKGSITEKEYNDIRKELDTSQEVEKLSGRARYYFRLRGQVRNALGQERVTLKTKYEDVDSGDLVILTSKGIHHNLTIDNIKSILKQAQSRSSSPQAIAEALVGKAYDVSLDQLNNDRAEPNDMTAIVIQIPKTPEEIRREEELSTPRPPGQSLGQKLGGIFRRSSQPGTPDQSMFTKPPEDTPPEAPTPPPAPAGAQPEEATKLQFPQETQETITPQVEETVKNLLPPLRQAITDNNQDQKQALEAQIAEAFHLSPDQRYLTDEERSALLETHPDIFGVTTLVDSVYQASLTQRFFFQAPVELQEALARYQEANRLSTPLEKHSSSKEAYEKFRDALERAAGIDREADRARRWEYDLKLASAEGELKQVLFNPTFSAEELKELLIKRNLARHEIVQVDLEQGERLHRFLDGLAEKAGLTIKMARFGAFQLVEKTPPQLGGP